MTYEQMVLEFHDAYEVPSYPSPTIPFYTRRHLRINLMREELKELERAMVQEKFVQIADGIADLMYVVIGTAWEYGLGQMLPDLFSEVHRSNMSKLGMDGKAIKREDGKVLKGPNFSPPDLTAILDKYISKKG